MYSQFPEDVLNDRVVSRIFRTFSAVVNIYEFGFLYSSFNIHGALPCAQLLAYPVDFLNRTSVKN